ncbi:thymidylate synthase [Citrobacter phage Merlin]|uniref:dCMP hydroxymethylase n=1 Tax=Citrobacter phage Merlin TaxID=1675602 RepID=A0A0K1LNG2_9CAUD|nr:thymidylate synthase [Citrobacter phage Merlin]AKU43690.1 dCMP hydroxymethylase [Citrobacter phage Merlin]
MIVTPLTVEDIRDELCYALESEQFVIDKTGAKTIEIIGASFIADEELIFGAVNNEYVERELEWYKSQSLFVKDIPGGTPSIWEQVSSKNGEINSNYGWAIWSDENCSQYNMCLGELGNNPDTRRAIMIYTRPSMQFDYNRDGMSDFMCTNTVQYLIRNKRVHAIVSMRSNDVVFGFRNDYAWQKYVLDKLVSDLNEGDSSREYKAGDIIWNAGSLHVYERHFYLVDHYLKTGKSHVLKKDYKGEWK